MIARRFTLSSPVSSCARTGRFRLAPAMVVACVVGLCLSAAPALAAGPEAPLIKVRDLQREYIKLGIQLFPNAPGEAGTFKFLYKQSATECQGGGTVGPFYESGGQEETGELIQGLKEGTQYTVCASLTTPAGTTLSVPLTFTTAVRPETPKAVTAEPVGGRTATLHGVLNPLAERKFEPGSYRFVYRPLTNGECQGAGEVATPAVKAAGAREEAVSAQVSGLIPHTRYAFCLVAENETTNENVLGPETVAGASASFTTLVAGPAVEEPSASDVAATSATLNANVNPGGLPTTYVFEYAPVGGSFLPVLGAEGEGSLPEGNTGVPVSAHVQGLQSNSVYEFRVIATNSVETVTGEVASFLTQIAGGAFALPDGRQWELVSPPDKHGAYIYPFTEFGLAAQSSVDGDAMTFLTNTPTEGEPPGYTTDEQVLATRGPDGWVSRDISPPNERVAGAAVGHGSEYVAFSEDLSLAVVQPHGFFNPSLSPEASAQTAYLHTNFLDGNVNDPCVESCYRPLVTGKPGYANVPSGTVFGEECTKGSNICGPQFTGATPDLSHIALASPEPLLARSNENEGGYEWVDGRLSPGNHLPGLRVSTSEDGSWKYFMSESALAAGAIAGQPNMYVGNGGVTKLVAVLSKADFLDWTGQLTSRTSRVSPDGRWFAFMSQQELTNYNTHDAVSGQPDEEVYLYHAPEDLATEASTLVCASCNPTGARPVGVEYKKLVSNERDRAISETEWNEDQWIAANVPGWTPYALLKAIYQSRYLSDSGRLFFDSNDALVPQDVNGNEDVYEYEPPGVGSCTTASGLYSARSGGCVDLISSGQDAQESAFMDASGSGGDVFFETAAKLVGQDYDTAYDVYDAHECTSAVPCFPTPAAVPPPCDTGDACKPAPTPQPTIFGAPSSETFSGPGNVSPAPAVVVKAKVLTRAQKLTRALKACHSKKGKQRGACERQARARYGARKSSRAAKKDRG